MAFRVPTANVSVVDLTVKLEKETNYEEIIEKMKEYSEGSMKGVLGVTDEALVSSDFNTTSMSSFIDTKAGIMLNSTFVKGKNFKISNKKISKKNSKFLEIFNKNFQLWLGMITNMDIPIVWLIYVIICL